MATIRYGEKVIKTITEFIEGKEIKKDKIIKSKVIISTVAPITRKIIVAIFW